MFLNQIRLNNYGTLQQLQLEQISPGLTLLRGLNPQAGNDFVDFVRSALLQFPISPQQQLNGISELVLGDPAGELVVSLADADRNRLHASVAAPERALKKLLPQWIDDHVLREICTPGSEEAGRFALLEQLCCGTRSETAAVPSAGRIRRTLKEVRGRRDGTGLDGGIVHQISVLRREQGRLQRKVRQQQLEDQRNSKRLEELQLELREVGVREQQLQSQLEQLRLRRVRCAALLCLDSGPVPATAERHLSRSASTAAWVRIRDLVAQELRRAVALQLRDAESIPDADHERTLQDLDQQLQSLRQAMAVTARSAAADSEMLEELQQGIQKMKDRVQSEQLRRPSASARRLRLMEHCLMDIVELLEDPGINPSYVGSAAQAAAGDDLAGESLLCEAASRSLLAELRAAEQQLESQLASLQSQRLRMQESESWLRSVPTLEEALPRTDRAHAEIARLAAEIELLQEQRRKLDQVECALLRALSQATENSTEKVLAQASEWIRKITQGQYTQLEVSDTGRFLLQQAGKSEAEALTAVDPVLGDLAGLVLRLALLQQWRAEGLSLPLVLREVTLQKGVAWADGVAAVLTTVAAAGQQLLLLSDIAEDVLPAAEIRCLTMFLPEQEPVIADETVAMEEVPATLEFPGAGSIDEEAEDIAVETGTPDLQLMVNEPEQPCQTATAPQATLLYYLSASDCVEDLADIRLGELEALRLSGIESVRQLLECSVEKLLELTVAEGFSVPPERLRALRGQAELCVRVPMLRRSDAALLYASGIHSADQLQRLRPERLYEAVVDFQSSREGRAYRRRHRAADRQQALNWARFGQESRSLQQALNTASDSVSADRLVLPGRRRRNRVRNRVAAHPLPENHSKVTVVRRRQRRLRHLQRRASELRSGPAASAEGEVVEQIGGMRFYLKPASGVGSVPLIGPRTAQLLQDSGITNVTDLLSLPPLRIVRRLGQSRVTEAVVQQWQSQARLMCQIPELRGGAAQFLVAAGVRSAESLSESSPDRLLELLNGLLQKRQQESGHADLGLPDRETVAEWISWAANARPLKAA